MRIIIADDHRIYAEGLGNLLRSYGFDIAKTVRDGRQAVDAALELKPDVVLMDVRMPIMDGIEATRRIKAAAPAIRIIMLTGLDDDESRIKAATVGASGYLLKNLDGEALKNRLLQPETCGPGITVSTIPAGLG